MKNRYLTLLFFLVCDFLAAVGSMALAMVIVGKQVIPPHFGILGVSYILWPAILILVMYILKIYNILWSHSSLNELVRIIAGDISALVIFFVAQRAIFNKSFEFPVFVILFFLVSLIIMFQRLSFKKLACNFEDNYKKSDFDNKNTSDISGNIMLIGAGNAGEMIISEMNRKRDFFTSKIRCVIDDDPYKKGQYISGIRIIGGREMIIEAAKKYDISVIIFAIPTCSSEDKSEILNICQKTDCKLKIVPSICKMYNLAEISSSIRKVEIEDLLGRDPIDVNAGSNLDYVKNKVVMVTGGGGTIGSELCRQIASHSPRQLIIFDIYENSAYELQNELLHSFPGLNLLTLIGSVRDSKRLDNVFNKYRPDIVYHAAAHKHVPLMEESPNETIKNNIFGTFKTAQCADKYGVKKFVLISTDKAVNPTNIMGASKRICEMIVQTCNRHSNTEFVAVRFGNVLGSNGSVIPLFKKQIEHGGPVTVTDPNIIRYFMTIPEAVSLVLQAGASAKGGEIFVLDMGKPVKILDLAENLIKLSGFTPYKDIKIEFTGLRPGEKLYEELLMSEEGLTATDNNLIHIGKPIDIDEAVFFETIEQMKAVMYDDSADVRALVKKLVPTFRLETK